MGLNWLDFGARNYDPALGRWMNIDPVADIEPSLTPFRYAFNNPLSFIDPDGMYEWRVNTETGEYERIGDKGGDEYQHVYLNDDKKAQKAMKGSTIYVGAVAKDWHKDGEFSFQASTTDLWSDLPDEYQGAYTAGALVERYKAMKEGGQKAKDILEQEAAGLPRREQVWNLRDFKRKLIESQGNDSGLALAAYTGMLQEIVGNLSYSGITNSPRTRKKMPTYNPKMPKLSNNSWIRYLQQNGHKYKGKGYGNKWIQKAAEDYKALKAAGKI